MTTFASRLLEAYREAPEQAALHLLHAHQPDQAISYRQLFEGAAGYARSLAEAGVQPGEVVVLILNHGEDLIYAFFGAVLQGAIPSIMPPLTEKLDAGVYRQSLAALFEVTAPAAVVTYPEFESEVRAAGANQVLLSGSVPARASPNPEALPGLLRLPGEVALLQHSSGTTGLQKGVALSHRAVFNQLDSYGRALHLHSGDVVVSWLPLYHDMGLIAGFLLPILSRLAAGAAFALRLGAGAPAPAPGRFPLPGHAELAAQFCLQLLRPEDPAARPGGSGPVLLAGGDQLLRAGALAQPPDFPGAFCPVRAESLSPGDLLMPWRRTSLPSPRAASTPRSRWMSSTGRCCCTPAAWPGPPGMTRLLCRCSPAGSPIDNTRLRVLDSQAGDLPERSIGEIALLSDCMLTGYYHRPDLTEKAFRDGWYLTGDLGYLADGELYITGRKKDLIIVGGKNVYPQDLERLAGDVPGVHPGRVVAFGVYNQHAGTEDVVIVAESDEQDPAARYKIEDEIRLRVTRGSDIALRYVRVVGRDWLLKTSSGKIARAANREKYLTFNP